MKIIKYSVLILLLFFLVSCNKETTTKSLEQLTINYYDGDLLISKDVYTKDIFALKSYSKSDYNFMGWFLDKDFITPFNENDIDKYFEMKEITLYAKMSKIMKNHDIEIIGKLNEFVVLNPVFTWKNVNQDESFLVEIYKESSLLFSKTVASTNLSLDEFLESDTSYQIKVIGISSNHFSTLDFSTGSFSYASKNITVNNPFMSDMVIQRDEEIIFSGSAAPYQLIKVEIKNNTYYCVTNQNGKYEVVAQAHQASFDPITIKISNGIDKTTLLQNVLFGDVYLFAGQSNMQWPTNSSDYLPSDVTLAIESKVRFFAQDVVESTTKLDSVKNGRWFEINNNNYGYFSAIAFMSGSILSNALKEEVPIGIITAYQGNTNIANWMGSEYYQGNTSTKYVHYNAMIYPLRHTKISGVVWYQGENNSAQGGDYKNLLLQLFKNYRDLFNSPNTPFFVIGLCSYDGDSGNNFDFSYVRESQALACMEDGNAYFISTSDGGDRFAIHPTSKRYIALRVAKSIQSVIYHKDYLAEGPMYKSHTVNGNVVIIELYNSEGLRATGKIEGLYIAGEDGKYYLAEASVVGRTIVASTSKVANPVYIKYGFEKSPFVNIFNKDDFAITPFRTDDYNTNIDLLEYNTLDKYTYHPDGSQMQVSFNEGNLAIEKKNDGKTFGSVRLDYWGMISYNPEGFRFTIIGTNSKAYISFRLIEGTYETWGYRILDDFIGERTFEISISEFNIEFNKQDGKLDTQMILYVEVMIESPGAASFIVKEARFIEMEKTSPLSFAISNVTENEKYLVVNLNKSIFADEYFLVIREKGLDSDIIYQIKQSDLTFIIGKEQFRQGEPYYIYVKAINDFGEKDASNNGFVFYLKDDNSVIVCNFDFKSQEGLNAYIASSMSVHNGLTVTLEEEGIKILSSGQGWQQFIFKLETGIGEGMTKLRFNANFSDYHGDVILQLADTSWRVYEFRLDLSIQDKGTFVINFSDFKLNGTTPFTNQTLMWIMFNFNDVVGNGSILFDDCILTK